MWPSHARFLITVPQSRRIEDRIRNLSRNLMLAEENSNEFQTIAAELRYAIFTLKWQIRMGLKNFPPELDRRAHRRESGPQ